MDSTSSSGSGNGFRSRWQEEESGSASSHASSPPSPGHTHALRTRRHSEAADTSLLNRAHAATRQAGEYALDEEALGKLANKERTVILGRYLQYLKSSSDPEASGKEQLPDNEAALIAALIAALKTEFGELGEVREADWAKAGALFADFALKQDAHEQALASQWKKARSGYNKELWDIVAGACAYGFCFGGGTLVSRLSSPVVGPAVAAWAGWGTNVIAWTLVERLLPLMRISSWSTKAADVDYPLLIRLDGRMVHDAVTARAGLLPKKFFVRNADGTEEHLTAAEYRARLSWWQAWKGKVLTDDLPYFCYTLSYFIRHLTFDTVTTSQFRKSTLGILTNASTHFFFGTLAGASTMAIMQAMRRRSCMATMGDNYRKGESLTITPEIRGKEVEMLSARLALMDMLAASIERNDANILAFDEKSTLAHQLHEARIRDTWGKLIWTEFCIPFSLSRTEHIESFGLRGEVSGKLYSTIISSLAKASCLLQSLLVTTYLLNINADMDDAGTLAWKHGLSQVLLILWFGFAARKEWELFYSALAALLTGIKSDAMYLLALTPQEMHALETVVIVADVLRREKSMRSLVSLSQLPSLPGSLGSPKARTQRTSSTDSEEDRADDALSRPPSPVPSPQRGNGYAYGSRNRNRPYGAEPVLEAVMAEGGQSPEDARNKPGPGKEPPHNGHGNGYSNGYGNGHGKGRRNGSARQSRIDGSAGSDSDDDSASN
jgi:hypothetical protein